MEIGNIWLLLPVLVLVVMAFIVLIIGVFAEKNPLGKLEHFFAAHYLAPSLMGVVLVLACGIVYLSMNCIKTQGIKAVGLFISGGNAQITVDPFAAIFIVLAISGTIAVMLMSIDYFTEFQKNKAEYYSLLMFATAAACLVACATDLIAFYLSIEFLSLTSYILAAYNKQNRRSAEAGLKYFLYGAAASAIMLYGMSILFGICGGKTEFSAIANAFKGIISTSGIAWVGIMFTLIGMAFKLALVPLHFWAPDTYQGAPTPITGFLSVVSKAAGLAVITRFLVVIATPGATETLGWYWVLVVLAILSMFYGNFVAIPQKNIKRMLAYSSIAQIGYMMVGVLAAMNISGVGQRGFDIDNSVVKSGLLNSGASWDLMGIMLYIGAYLFMNLGAFAIICAVGKALGSDEIDSYAGMMKISPFYAISLAVFMVSLAGIPPTAGFLGKFFVFGSAFKAGAAHPELVVLAVIGVFNSVISAFYYLNIVRIMFFVEPKNEFQIKRSLSVNSAIVFMLIATLALIILIKPVTDLLSKSVNLPSVQISRMK